MFGSRYLKLLTVLFGGIGSSASREAVPGEGGGGVEAWVEMEPPLFSFRCSVACSIHTVRVV